MIRRVACAAALALVASRAAAEPLLPAGAPPRWTCGEAAPGWERPDFDDRAFEERPAIPDAGTGCARAQLLRWRFTAPRGLERAVVTLHARYQHGFAAYLDGVEVARRRLAPAASLDAPATDVHGPEWERIPLPARGLPAGPHTLAVEVHPRSAAREASFDVELTAGNGPRLAHGPYLVETNVAGATVALETDVPTLATLAFGPSEALESTAADRDPAAPSRRHLFVMGGLRSATTYHYRVAARATEDAAPVESEVYAFHTPPERGRPLRFVIYGDVRSGHDVHADLVRAITAEDPDLAIVTGDLVDMGSDEADWDRYFELATPLLARVAVYPSPGNHEYARGGRGAERFRALFRPNDPDGAPWRSFDVAGVHFIALDSNSYRAPAQLEWLRRDLARNKAARAIVAYSHEGAYSSGLHGDNETAKAQYAPLLERAGAALYVSGHDHHYERGRVGKLDYIVSGGGGAELRSQRCGVPGRRPCLPRVAQLVNEHHYIVVEVLPGFLRLCPKLVDGTPIEPCVSRPLPTR